MAARTSAIVLNLFVVAAAQIHPTDIIHRTGSVLYDLHSAAYDAAGHHITKSGLHTQAKEHYKNIVGDDIVGSTCKKVGCDAKDVQAKLNQAHATVQQGKAKAYDLSTQASEHLNGFADTIVTKLETHAPQYKGSIRKSFLDLVLVTLYFGFVAYMSIRCAVFGFKKAFSIFCCVCCCGMCLRRKSGDSAKKSKNSGKADAKAAPKKTAKKA